MIDTRLEINNDGESNGRDRVRLDGSYKNTYLRNTYQRITQHHNDY